MNQQICKCSLCGKFFSKCSSEFNRKIKNKTPFYCSKNCAGKISIKTNKSIKRWNTSKENKKHLKQYCCNRRDEYSDFKYLFQSLTLRKKEGKKVLVNLQDLKTIWNNQNGCCAILKHKLILPTYKNTHKNPNYLASLDRIDSNKGYEVDNIRFVCLSINYAKNKFNDVILNEFIELCKQNHN